MRLGLGRFLTTLLVLLPSVSLASPPETVLLLDSQEGAISTRAMEVVKAHLMRIYRVVDATEAIPILEREPGCDTDGKATELTAKLQRGVELFFEKTDIEGATSILSKATTDFFAAPCILRGDRASFREVCRISVMLVRLYLLLGRQDEASHLGFHVRAFCPAEIIQQSEEPPEVTSFVLEKEVGHLEAEVRLREPETMSVLLVNGLPQVIGNGAMTVRLPQGVVSEIALIDTSGKAFVWRGVGKRRTYEFHVGLAGKVRAGPSGSLQLIGGSAEEVARELTLAYGYTVLLVKSQDDGLVRVVLVESGQGSERILMELRPLNEKNGGFEVSVEPGGPLLARPAWPWPYVALGASAALLGAGIYLNVLTNNDAKAVNDGRENRVADYQTHRRWSIACYSVAGVTAAAGIVLFLLKPEAKEKFIVFDAGSHTFSLRF